MTRRTAALALALPLSLPLAGCSRSRDAMTTYSGRTQNLAALLLLLPSGALTWVLVVRRGDAPG
jgi:hypothetical protein